MATYRLQLNDQCGTIRFNKIVSYVRFYEKVAQEDGSFKWVWSKELYPFSVSVLPEPVIKADYGQPGLDSFELDIQINYGQMISRISESGTDVKISFDTNIVNNHDGWAVLNAPSVSSPSNQQPAEPADISGNNFFGVQWDKRVFASTDVDLNLYDVPGTYIGDRYKKEYGRINSENKSYVYNDVDLVQKINGQYNQDYMFSFRLSVESGAINDVTDGSVIVDPNDPTKLIATTDYSIRYTSGTEVGGVYQDTREILYFNDSAATSPVDAVSLSEAIVSRDAVITQMREDYENLPEGDPARPTAKSVEWVEVANQFATNNILDFSNNGLFYDFQAAEQRNFDYSSYFKWMTDNTGAQDPAQEFALIEGEEVGDENLTWMKPTLDLQNKILAYDKVTDRDGYAIRLIASSDYDDYKYWDYTSISDSQDRQETYRDSSRDYSPSHIPGIVVDTTPGDRNVISYDKIGFGQFRSPWQHIIGKRIYGMDQVWGKKLNAQQIGLFRFDGNTTYRYANEQYFYNKALVGNDIYSGIGYNELTSADIQSGSYPIFKPARYNADNQKDIIDDSVIGSEAQYRYAMNGSVFTHTKLGEYILLWSKANENLNGSHTNFIDGTSSRVIFGIQRQSIDPYANYTTGATDIVLHSGTQFRNLNISEVSIAGRSYGNVPNDVNAATDLKFVTQAAMRVGTGASIYTGNATKAFSNVSAFALKNWNPSWENTGTNNSWFGGSMLGFNMELRVKDVQSEGTSHEARGNYAYINKSSFGTISGANTSKELGLPSGVIVDNTGFESASIVVDTNSTNNYDGKIITHLTSYIVAKDFENAISSEVGTILSSDQTSYSMLFRTTGQTIEEEQFIGYQSGNNTKTRDRRTTDEIADGTLISAKFLTGILKMPGDWTYENSGHTHNSSTFRLGSYSDWTIFEESDFDLAKNNHWDIYSSLIANYGDQYQNGRIIFNVEDNLGYNDPNAELTRDLLTAYKHNIAETVGADGSSGDFKYNTNTIGNADYKRFNLSINRKSDNQSSQADFDNVAFDLNFIRNNNNGNMQRYYKSSAESGINVYNRPASFGFTTFGSFFFDVWNNGINTPDNFEVDITKNPQFFDRQLLVTSNVTVMGGNILPRRSYVNVGDTYNIDDLVYGAMKAKDISHFYGISELDPIPAEPTNVTPRVYLAKQVNSGNSVGYLRNATTYNKSYVNQSYTNAIVYNPSQDYADFITGNDWNTNDVVTHEFDYKPRGNMYYAYYGFTNSIADKADWRAHYVNKFNQLFNNEGAGLTDKTIEVFASAYPFFDVQYNSAGENTVPSEYNNWMDIERMKAVASFMNTDVIGNLIPSVANSADNGFANALPAINWKYREGQHVLPFGYTNPAAAIYNFNVYGQSVFSLGKEWQSFASASFNRLTTAVLTYPDYENNKPNYYPYMDGTTFGVTSKGFEITEFQFIKSQNYYSPDFNPTLMPMRNLDILTGDLIPEQNTVLRYFNSNHEVYMGTKASKSDNIGVMHWYGYIMPSAPALGSSTKRFSDGYFNRLSVRFAGQHDETILFEDKTFHRQESPEYNFDLPSDKSNRYPQYIFGQDTHDSGYIEFINQPHREDPNTFSRFVMEPTGGDDRAVGYSGASAKKTIAHSMMWNHSIKIPDAANKYNYDQRMDDINPFTILPQMAFEETTSFDTSNIPLETRPIVRFGDGQEYKWIPTIDLGGFYAGHRNPTNAAMANQVTEEGNNYSPTYLYEFRNVYSMDAWISNRLNVTFINGTWNSNMIGLETDIVPVYSYIDIGNKYYKFRDAYMTTINLIYDSADYSNSLLVQESERQLVFNNITRDSINGRENNIENNFFMKFGGLSRYEFASENVGYNNDSYIRTKAMSTHTWDYTEYNTFQIDWGWDYTPAEVSQWTNGSPFDDYKIRFQILPQMATIDGINYPYPTMDLGGYDETLDKPRFFHTVHQWHVKTGTIGVLGSAESTGTDNRAVDFLNSIAFHGGIKAKFGAGATGTWTGAWDPTQKFAHALFNDASTFAGSLHFFDDKYLSDAATSWAAEYSQELFGVNYLKSEIYTKAADISRAMNIRNQIYGVTYNVKNDGLTEEERDQLRTTGQTKVKGIYGVHMLQGEVSMYTSSGITSGSTSTTYLPIYVAGDLLPTITTLTTSSGSGTFGIVSTRNEIYSSLGAPGQEWESVWSRNMFVRSLYVRNIDEGIKGIINTDILIADEIQTNTLNMNFNLINDVQQITGKNVVINTGYNNDGYNFGVNIDYEDYDYSLITTSPDDNNYLVNQVENYFNITGTGLDQRFKVTKVLPNTAKYKVKDSKIDVNYSDGISLSHNYINFTGNSSNTTVTNYLSITSTGVIIKKETSESVKGSVKFDGPNIYIERITPGGTTYYKSERVTILVDESGSSVFKNIYALVEYTPDP